MSSKAVFVNDLKKLRKPSNNELKSRKKKLLIGSSISKISAFANFKQLHRNESLSRVNLRCLYTGRKKGLVRKTKMTRSYFKVTAFKGLIPGLRKSSW